MDFGVVGSGASDVSFVVEFGLSSEVVVGAEVVVVKGVKDVEVGGSEAVVEVGGSEAVVEFVGSEAAVELAGPAVVEVTAEVLFSVETSVEVIVDAVVGPVVLMVVADVVEVPLPFGVGTSTVVSFTGETIVGGASVAVSAGPVSFPVTVAIVDSVVFVEGVDDTLGSELFSPAFKSESNADGVGVIGGGGIVVKAS